MAGGGFARLPDGSVIVALTLPLPVTGAAGASADGPGDPYGAGTAGSGPRTPAPRPGGPYDGALPHRRRWSAHADEPHTVRAAEPLPGDELRVRVLVHAVNRARALTRLRNLGMRAVYLRGNAEPPTPDEITAVLHHPEGLVWRTSMDADTDPWRPIASLLRPPGGVRTAQRGPGAV